MDPRDQEFSELQLNFFKLLDTHNIKLLRVGFATESDESSIRHVSAVLKAPGDAEEEIDPGDANWPDEVDISRCDMWDICSDERCDNMVYIDPVAKNIEAQYGLYITEPELRDDGGGDVCWNYHE